MEYPSSKPLSITATSFNLVQPLGLVSKLICERLLIKGVQGIRGFFIPRELWEVNNRLINGDSNWWSFAPDHHEEVRFIAVTDNHRFHISSRRRMNSPQRTASTSWAGIFQPRLMWNDSKMENIYHPNVDPQRGEVGGPGDNTSCGNASEPCTTMVQYIGYMYIITPMTIIGTMLNMINQIIFWKYRNQGSTYFYLLSLAAIDMISLLLAIPIGPTRCIPPTHSWEVWARGIFEAYFYLGLGVIFDTMSIWCTMVMSVDRYIQVRATGRTVFIEGSRGPKVILATVVALSVAINAPYFFIKTIDEDGTAADTDFSMTTGFQVYMWIRMSLVKILPVLTVAVANGLLIKVLVDINRRRKSMVFPNTRQARRQRMQVCMIPKASLIMVYI